MSGEPAVVLHGVHKAFDGKRAGGRVQALHDVGLQVPHGALSALVGPDGAGKTTLLRLVAGLLRADAGTLQVLGLDPATQAQAIQDRISYMPQRFGLYEDLSVQENLDLYADLHGVPAAQRGARFERLLHMTDLARFTARLAGQLSGGMKQKLGLACTLVRSPQLLLLDEPTVGVDPLSRRELWSIVERLVADDGLSVLVTTAYLDEAERCACVHVLHEGRVLAGGSPEQLREPAAGLCFVATPPAGEPPRRLQARLFEDPAVIDAVPRRGQVHFMRRGGAGELPAEPEPPRLEDGFMLLLAGQRAQHDEAAPAALAPAPATDPGPVIEVRNLVRRFGDFVAVDRTSFDVRRGEIFGLLGPNGAGKTTTFRMLCGLLPVSSGEARVAGLDLRRARAAARGRIGYVAQKFALYANLSVAENLRFFGGAYGLRGARLQQRIASMLTQFELQGLQARPAGQLPGGVKQRLAMAVGLLHDPEILFLDEPTSGADPLARRGFWRRITALAAAGTTIVVTTHFMEEAEFCDRIVIQDGGRVLALGTPAEVRRQAGETPSHRLDMEQAFIAIVEGNRPPRSLPVAAPRGGALRRTGGAGSVQ